MSILPSAMAAFRNYGPGILSGTVTGTVPAVAQAYFTRPTAPATTTPQYYYMVPPSPYGYYSPYSYYNPNAYGAQLFPQISPQTSGFNNPATLSATPAQLPPGDAPAVPSSPPPTANSSQQAPQAEPAQTSAARTANDSAMASPAATQPTPSTASKPDIDYLPSATAVPNALSTNIQATQRVVNGLVDKLFAQYPEAVPGQQWTVAMQQAINNGDSNQEIALGERYLKDKQEPIFDAAASLSLQNPKTAKTMEYLFVPKPGWKGWFGRQRVRLIRFLLPRQVRDNFDRFKKQLETSQAANDTNTSSKSNLKQSDVISANDYADLMTNTDTLPNSSRLNAV